MDQTLKIKTKKIFNLIDQRNSETISLYKSIDSISIWIGTSAKNGYLVVVVVVAVRVDCSKLEITRCGHQPPQ